MPACKQHDAFLYHPTLSGYDGSPCELFGELLSNPNTFPHVITDRGGKFVLNLERRSEDIWLITVQALKSDEFPKMADDSDGRNEEDLTLPSGKSLSYKNIFIYSTPKNLFVAARLHSFPSTRRLAFCLKSVVEELEINNGAFSLRLGQLFEHSLVEKLRAANAITFAEFTSMSDYYGDNINEDRLTPYDQYLGGQDYTKTTRLRGKRGANIKHVVNAVIEDYIANGGLPEGLGVKMKVDGEDINFRKFFKKFPIDVMMEEENSNHIDYCLLERKLIDVIDNFEVQVA